MQSLLNNAPPTRASELWDSAHSLVRLRCILHKKTATDSARQFFSNRNFIRDYSSCPFFQTRTRFSVLISVQLRFCGLHCCPTSLSEPCFRLEPGLRALRAVQFQNFGLKFSPQKASRTFFQTRTRFSVSISVQLQISVLNSVQNRLAGPFL